MAKAQPSLELLRGEIDEIDASLHDLLVRRTEVSRRIGAAKGPQPVAFRPGREAVVLRRLLAEHRGDLPKPVLVRIWREIFADSLAQQGPFTVTAAWGEGEASLTALARDHFGVLTPIGEEGSAVRVIQAVAEGRASVGVLHLPEADAPDSWWRHLARSGEGVPRIIARLPFAAAAAPSSTNGLAALVIGLTGPEETGEDRSFLVVEAGQQVSRSAFKGMLGKAGMTVRETAIWHDEPDRWLHFAEVEGFVADGDARLRALVGLAGDTVDASWVIGAYPVPLSDAELGVGGSGRSRRRAGR